MIPTSPLLIRPPRRKPQHYPKPTGKQVALFCYLSQILWKLSCRIPWGRLANADYRKLREVEAMLSRAAAKAKTARLREPGKGEE